MSEACPAEPPDILGSLWVRETRSIARRATALDRSLPRGLRHRPVHVREQLPGRRHARQVRPALPGFDQVTADLHADERDELFAPASTSTRTPCALPRAAVLASGSAAHPCPSVRRGSPARRLRGSSDSRTRSRHSCRSRPSGVDLPLPLLRGTHELRSLRARLTVGDPSVTRVGGVATAAPLNGLSLLPAVPRFVTRRATWLSSRSDAGGQDLRASRRLS
jgi:hypothetical protein